MDRFIVTKLRKGNKWCKGLKSNMDRFIGFDIKPNFLEHIKFKIQYGQIYSELIKPIETAISSFKIQYGQIYRCKLQLWKNRNEIV